MRYGWTMESKSFNLKSLTSALKSLADSTEVEFSFDHAGYSLLVSGRNGFHMAAEFQKHASKGGEIHVNNSKYSLELAANPAKPGFVPVPAAIVEPLFRGLDGPIHDILVPRTYRTAEVGVRVYRLGEDPRYTVGSSSPADCIAPSLDIDLPTIP